MVQIYYTYSCIANVLFIGNITSPTDYLIAPGDLTNNYVRVFAFLRMAIFNYSLVIEILRLSTASLKKIVSRLCNFMIQAQRFYQWFTIMALLNSSEEKDKQ